MAGVARNTQPLFDVARFSNEEYGEIEETAQLEHRIVVLKKKQKNLRVMDGARRYPS